MGGFKFGFNKCLDCFGRAPSAALAILFFREAEREIAACARVRLSRTPLRFGNCGSTKTCASTARAVSSGQCYNTITVVANPANASSCGKQLLDLLASFLSFTRLAARSF